MLILLYAVVTLGYLGLAVWAWRCALAADTPNALLAVPAMSRVARGPGAFGPLERLALFAIWIAHLWLLALLPWWFPGTSSLAAADATRNPAFDAHVVVALLSYSLLTIAALHALLMAALDRWLHQSEVATVSKRGLWARIEGAILGQLPPLMTMEQLLFRLVAFGFALLTLTVLTGIVFSEALFGRPLTLDHKTVFTLISWLIFAALLFGRRLYGWRGRVALRWTLSGFVAMFLAYAGSRFVLEVVLHRV